jgi:hypothetical protein
MKFAKLSFSKPHSSSVVPAPRRHSESPLCCITSTRRSTPARVRASSTVIAVPSGRTVRKIRPLLMLELWGMTIASQPSMHCVRSARHSASAVPAS